MECTTFTQDLYLSDASLCLPSLLNFLASLKFLARFCSLSKFVGAFIGHLKPSATKIIPDISAELNNSSHRFTMYLVNILTDIGSGEPSLSTDSTRFSAHA